MAYDCLGLWVYYYLNGNAYFKKYSSAGTELASFSAPVDTFYWLEPSPDPSLNGFWAIGKTIIRWYEHSAYQDGSLSYTIEITGNDGYGHDFIKFTDGKTDLDNNFWFVDAGLQRIYRINFSTQQIDFMLLI